MLTGCAASTDLGILHGRSDGTGGSLNAHLGVGSVQRNIFVIDGAMRLAVASNGSRLAFGGSALGGIPIGKAHALARVGVWRAPLSSLPEAGFAPTFELGGFWPLRKDPIDPPSKFGWFANGVIFGIRQDLRGAGAEPTTMLFVGFNIFMIPGY